MKSCSFFLSRFGSTSFSSSKTVRGVLALCMLGGFVSCESPEIAARNKVIAAEPAGNYYVGRRYHVPFTRFWGYVREPRQSWEKAQLVVMDESVKHSPDRLPESTSGLAHGYDNNYEYILRGRYTGKTVYDPNSNLVLPAFQATSYEVKSENPGFLFDPNDRYSTEEVTFVPKKGIRNSPTVIESGR